MRAVHIKGIAALMGATLVAAGASPLDANRQGLPLRAPLSVYVGHPAIVSFPAVRQVRVVAGGERLRATRISGNSVRLTVAGPGTGYLCIETPAGREVYAVHAGAAPRQPNATALSHRRTAWLHSAWSRLRTWAVRVAAAPARARLAARPPVSIEPRSASPAPAFAPTAPAERPRPLAATWIATAPRTGAMAPSVPRTPIPGTRAPAANMLSVQPARRKLPAVASACRLSMPSPQPTVGQGTVALGALSGAPPRSIVAQAPQPAVPIARIPRAAVQARTRPAGEALSDDERVVSLLAGARPVPAAVRVIPGLPQPADQPSDEPMRLSLPEGKSRILPCRGVRTVQIDDPTGAVAEIQPVSDTEVLLLAKGPGTTTLRIWDTRGRTEYEVTVEPGPARRQQSILDAIGLKGLTARVVENTCILEGEVANVEQLARAQRIAEAFVPKVVNLLRLPAPTPEAPPAPKEPDLVELVQAILPKGEVTAEALPGQTPTIVLRGKVPRVEEIQALTDMVSKLVSAKGTVVNLVQLAEPRQVRVQARMLSVDEGAVRELGVRWVDPSLTGPVLFGQKEASGGFRLLTSIQANIKTLMEDSRTELLSAPSTVVNSGAMGYIMIGGEIPIPQVTTLGLGTSGNSLGTSVVFRPFGVLLNLEPVVETGDDITLRLLVEVSSIDRNNSVTVNGSPIPGFATKRAMNELRLKAGETLVIGGLISREDATAVGKFPILGDIPVFGNFFKSVRRDKTTRELVLFLTPELLPGPEPPVGLRQLPALKPGSQLTGLGLSGGGMGSGMGTGGGTPGGGTGVR